MVIKTSQILEAGDGFYADYDIEPGQVIMQYEGPRRDLRDLTEEEKDRAVGVGYDVYVVGEPPGCKINDIICFKKIEEFEKDSSTGCLEFPKHNFSHNCEFKINNKGEFASIDIVATGSIKQGEELFINYGYNYWIRKFLEKKYITQDLAKKMYIACKDKINKK